MKRFSKKLAALLLVAVMAVSLFPSSVFAADEAGNNDPAVVEQTDGLVEDETDAAETTAAEETTAEEKTSDETTAEETATPETTAEETSPAEEATAPEEATAAPTETSAAEPTVPETPVAPAENSITAQPQDAIVAPYGKAVFEVQTIGKVSSYKWQYSTNNGLSWWNYGSKKSSITVTGSKNLWNNNNGNMYRCIVTFKDGTKVTSDAAVLHVASSQSFRNSAKKADNADVSVKAPAGTFPDETKMTVTDVAAENYVDAISQELGDVAAADITAVDISFEHEGEEIEPANDNKVTVTIKADAIKEGSKIVHIDDSGRAKEVPASDIVSITDGEVVFMSDAFSVYAVVWTDDSGEHSATITWGYLDGDTFKELEAGSTVTLDTTASTVSLENTYSGYYMIGATYKAPNSSEWVDINPARLTKVDNGWQITTVTKDDEGAVVSTNDTLIADGSEIRVIYGPVSGPAPSGSDDDSVPSPITEKNVIDNHDGTYTITLDTTATQVTETESVGANVLIVFDRTRSMNGSMSGASSRLAAAKSAVATLVNVLSTGDNAGNDIDYSLVSFYRVADSIHTWGTDAISGRTTWTKNATVFNNYVQALTVPGNNQTGTNWESGLYQANQALSSKDNDQTYVIFLTDGEPNRRGTTTYTNADTATAISYALTQARAITGTSNVSLYGVFCGSDSGYNNLANMISNAGGVQTINGTDNATLTSAFEDIAHTIVTNLGASNVAVDDGVPSLSNISANVAGEAGGYEYYIRGKDDADFTVWNDAPGAIYSQDNGVTWDLSSAGTLPAGTTYRIKFTVWPSQAAYDLIADLNNGLKEYDSLPADQKAAVTGNKTDGYTLVTNTHLNTTYTFNGQEYSDKPDELTYGSMPLPTKTVSVVKEWPANMVDSYGAAVYRDPVTGETKTATEIELTLQRDSADYLKFTVKGSEGWKKDDIYISSGNMTVANGVATIHETGHDYQIVEPPAFMYYWDLISDVYHPMVINGVNTLLVLDVDATSADVDNVTYFAIGKDADGNDKIYKKHDDSDNILKAFNYRRSNLNLTKQIFDYDGETAKTDENAEFVYKAKVTDAYSTDGYVWFSAWDPVAGGLVKDEWVTGTGVTAETNADGPTGYYYAPNGTELTMTIKAGWNVRFLNIYHGSTFSFEETGMPGNYEFSKVEATAQYNFVHTSSADWYTAAASSTTGKIEGTITEPNNNYTITYSNKVKAEFYIYHSGVAGDGNLETIPMTAVATDGTFNLYAKTTEGTLYGGYYLDYAGKGDYADDGVKGTTGVVYTGMNYDWSGAQTVNGTAIKPVAGETYYIKEVPTCYLRNYHQINYVKNTGKLMALYLISAVDDLNYTETGFVLKSDDNQKAKVVSAINYKNWATNKTVTLKANTVFKSLGITEDGEYLTYFDATESDYFAVGEFTVLPYWITPDGITVNGISTRTIKITSMTKSGVTKTDSVN